MARPTINARIFGVLMIFTQIVLAILHGIFIRPVMQATTGNLSNSSIYEPMIVSIMTVLGFGLIFSYNKRLLWSGLGYTFFIAAFCLQLYPLINAFWTKTQIMGPIVRTFPVSSFNNVDSTYPYYINRDSDPVVNFY